MAQLPGDEQPKVFTIPLTGKWKPAVDPLNLGDGDFAELDNMRYTEGAVHAILGQTKVNSTPVANVTIQSGVQLNRGNPVESKVIVQATDASSLNPKLYVNTTSVPTAGNFTVSPIYTEDTTAGTMRGSSAPTGVVAMCDGIDSLAYGGDEYPIAKLIDTDPAGSYDYDYTDKVTNSLTSEYATVHGAAAVIDPTTMLLLHLDNNVTDVSPTTPHTVTNTNVTFSTTSKFGTHAAVFNGTTARLTIPDDADFNLSSGVWTVEAQVKHNNNGTNEPIYYHGTDADNYMRIYLNMVTDLTGYLKLEIKATAVVVSLSSSLLTFSSSFDHLAVVGNATEYYMFFNGSMVGYSADADVPVNYTGTIYIGNDGSTNWFKGSIDEFRVSNSARWTSGFTPPSAAYGPTSITTQYIGVRLGAIGFKYYVGTANTSGTLSSVEYWGSGGWTSVSSLSDGTAVAGKTLAQTGTITFATTAGSIVPKQIGGAYIYWYRVILSGMDTTTTFYQLTEKTEVQKIKDLWDGIYRNTISYFKYNGSSFIDNTLGVRGRQYYLSSDSATYFQVNGLTTAQSIVAGFGERSSGAYFDLDAAHVNTTAGSLLSVDYWNGAAWTSLSGVSDGTISGTSSLGTSGAITWTAPAESLEFTRAINNGIHLYYYRFTFSVTVATDTRVMGVFGITAPKTIRGHKFPIMWQNRLGLGCETSKSKNTIKLSSANSFNVFNGSDSFDLPFGDDTEITIGGALFNRFGTALTDGLIVCKKTETWVADGIPSSNLQVYRVSSTYGCPAPGTFRICDVGYEISPGINKHIAIWFTGSAVVLFDQNAVLPIHDDIMNYFEKWRSEFINLSMIDKFYADYDQVNREYHLFVATGASTTLDTELVFDLKRKRWYNVERGAKVLSGAFPVSDSNGNVYNYGFDSSGYVYRLDFGQTFDGVSIIARFRPKDLVFASIHKRTHIRSLWLLAKSKNTTTNKVVLNHYANTSSVASPNMPTLSMADSTHRIALMTSGKADRSIGTPTAFIHTLDFSLTTSNESIGFEPMVVAGEYKLI